MNNFVKQRFLNTYVNNLSMKDCLEAIDSLVSQDKKSYIVAVNVDVIVKIEDDPYLKKIIDNAELVLVDGKPLQWIAKYQGNPIKEKISGSDLVPLLLKQASDKGQSVFIIGGKDGIAQKAKSNIEKSNPKIKIVGTYAPPLGFEKDQKELDKINVMISDCHPDILIACFGCHKQEKWIYENYFKYEAKLSVCAGATVDFLAGNVKRAPKWISNIGFEWFYRYLQEPKRLFRRYFVDDVKILKLVCKYCKKDKI